MNKFAVFTIAGEEFGIELEKIVEVVKSQKVTPLLKVPEFITGVINLRGNVIPLMDLRKRLGVKPSSSRARIIVTKIHGGNIGLLVDTVKEILTIEKEEIASTPSIFKGLKPEYIMGIGKIADRLIVILNLDNLLSSDEIMLLGEQKDALHPGNITENFSREGKEKEKK